MNLVILITEKIKSHKMIVSFAVVAAVLIIGFIVYKTRANIFTVAAIVLVLPAAKWQLHILLFCLTNRLIMN